ncbi:transposase [Sphingobium fontiphilum]|uniref:Transposase n=1 Tax=Sphingobium fontiphilum TaxID=944425 RepID=A0A7W6GMF7_9SPHN|nr:transposase [Sphingobium fontiphilum]
MRAIKEAEEMMKHSEEFRQAAVRFALASGLLGKWVSQYRPPDLVAAAQTDLARKNERLRLENRVLRQERDVLKRPRCSSRAKGREVRLCASLVASLAH